MQPRQCRLRLSLSSFPWAIVTPDKVTLKLPAAILKTREASFPLIVSRLAPGPVMVRPSLTRSSPVVSVIVCATEKTPAVSNVIVSGPAIEFANRIASRSGAHPVVAGACDKETRDHGQSRRGADGS
jgi:hypothetical protein